jgi:hypothetical protein
MSAHMTEDQTLLQDSAERYLRDSYDFNQRRERIAGGVYSDPRPVAGFCGNGLAGATRRGGVWRAWEWAPERWPYWPNCVVSSLSPNP